MTNGKPERYVGVDVGATKTLAALVEPSGTIVARNRADTPREGAPEDVLEAILEVVEDLLAQAGVTQADLAGVGLAVPGVVDREAGRVIVTPNMNLSGLVVVPCAEQRLGVPVVLGNDVNMGTLGEWWLGAARGAKDIVGIFPGTGIGGGIIIDGRLLEGHRSAAGEIGHIVMEIDGPLCGCGNRGCLEALASRTAIERDIRQAIQGGRKSVVEELTGGDLSRIRSGVLRKALKADDAVVTQVIRKAARILGLACLTVRHVLDPEVIVLGGGVIEACGFFIMPIVAEVVASDSLPAADRPTRVVPSLLGDDAVVLGAVAFARQRLGENPGRGPGGASRP